MQFILLTLACSFLPTYSAHVLSSRIFIRTIFIAQVKLDRFNRFVNNIVLKTCSPRGSSYAPFLPQQLEFFSSKRNISRFRIPSERGCNVVRGGRRKEEEGKGKEARTLESSLIKPLNFLLCHFFLPFPFLFFPPRKRTRRICVTHPRHGFFLPFADRENRYRTLFSRRGRVTCNSPYSPFSFSLTTIGYLPRSNVHSLSLCLSFK